MTLRFASPTSLVGWLSFVGLATGCVQVTNFADPTAGSDESTSSTDGPESMSSAGGPDSTGAGESSTGAEGQPGPGDSSWLRLNEEPSKYRGVARDTEGRVHAVGEQTLYDEPADLGRLYSADGETWTDLNLWEGPARGFHFIDACQTSGPLDGYHLVLGVVDGANQREGFAMPLVFAFDPMGGITDMQLIESWMPFLPEPPRLICNPDGMAWVAMPYIETDSPAVLLSTAKVQWGNDYPVDIIEGDGPYEILGLGRDELDNIHLAVRTGAEPASGEAVVRWRVYHAGGDALAEIELDVTELPGTQPVSFAVRGSHAIIATLDNATDDTWVVAYDRDGIEQWRTSDVPSPAQGWGPSRVALAEDGSVVMMATVGTAPDQHLGLFALGEGGVLEWSAEYPFEADGQPQLRDTELGDLDVGPDAIDVVGSAAIDGGDRVGWVRRVLR